MSLWGYQLQSCNSNLTLIKVPRNTNASHYTRTDSLKLPPETVLKWCRIARLVGGLETVLLFLVLYLPNQPNCGTFGLDLLGNSMLTPPAD